MPERRLKSSDIADPAVAARLDVVAVRTEILATAPFELHGLARWARPWITHHGDRIVLRLADSVELHKDCCVLRTIVYYATQLSLAWGIALTGLAAAGNTWVLDRVAGGYFAGEEMPLALRITYGVITVGALAVMWLAWRYISNAASSRQRRLGRLVIVLYSLSTIVNAISQSPPERFNAIPAAVIVLGFYVLRRRPLQQYVDLRTRR